MEDVMMEGFENVGCRKLLTVQRSYQSNLENRLYEVPMIRLKGKWLQELGFDTSRKVKVNAQLGSIEILDNSILCSYCNSGFMVKRRGEYGGFLGCTSYPRCRNTINLK